MCGFIGFSGNLDNKEAILQKNDGPYRPPRPGHGRHVHRRRHRAGVPAPVHPWTCPTQAHSPWPTRTKSVVVVFNGEIYNFMELRRSLRPKATSFHCGADTEVLIHGYEEYGTS